MTTAYILVPLRYRSRFHFPAVSHRKRTVLPSFRGYCRITRLALEAIARRFEVSARNPFALLEHVGSDVAGALQVLPPGVLPTDGSQREDQGQPIDSAGVAQMLRAAVDQYQTGSGATGSLGRFSLAGAQPKIALRRDGNQWSVPLGGAASTHILKPVTGALPTIDVVEYLTMRAAGLVGLSVAQSALATIEGIQVLISTRYDRRQEGNRVTRLHQEDLCQALAVSPEKKYQHQDGGPGVGAIAALVRSLPSREDQESVARHFEASCSTLSRRALTLTPRTIPCSWKAQACALLPCMTWQVPWATGMGVLDLTWP